MRYKKLGHTKMNISAISLGTWGIGGSGWGNTDYSQCEKAVKTMLELGVNLIDTAPAYNDGMAERFIGDVIFGNREELFLVTKTGTSYKNGKYIRDNSAKAIRKQCEESLRYLKTDYIDLYLVHWPDSNVPMEDTFSELLKLKDEKKIKHIGVSNFSLDELKMAEKFAEIEVIQEQYSLVYRNNQTKIQYAHEKGIGVMTYGSLGAGILSGKFKDKPKFESGDMRSGFYHFFEDPQFSRIQSLLKEMSNIAQGKAGVSASQVALNWNIQKEFVDTAIVGVRSVEHAIENCNASDFELTKNEMDVLDNWMV